MSLYIIFNVADTAEWVFIGVCLLLIHHLISNDENSAPGGIRTHGLPLRRRTLYPAELQMHTK